MTDIPRGALLRWAEVDAEALRHNAEVIARRLRPETLLMAMVKSDGYGHGAELTARAALAGGARWLGVFTPDEALTLRVAGLDAPLLVTGWSPPATHQRLVEANVDVAVFDSDSVTSLAAIARRLGHPARVHVKVDSGMSRLGVRERELSDLAGVLRNAAGAVEIAGVFTHFADADSADASFTHEQHRRFLDAAAVIRDFAPNALLHCTGSAAILRFPETHHDLVRLGIALYGYVPGGVVEPVPVRPAMSVLARVAQVKTVNAGDTVGYGRTWRAQDARRIATVAIGYGQGLPRGLSNQGWMVIRGARCPIVGVVNMDQVTLDVSDAGDVTPGDEAMLFGERDGITQGADQLASLLGTLPHELICAVAGRMPRVPVGARGGADLAALESATVKP